jgi:hypothetical protein
VRSVRADPGTATAQALNAFKRRLERSADENAEAVQLLTDCTDCLAHADLDRGGSLLSALIRSLSANHFSSSGMLILEECAVGLEESHAQHMEYLLLALHTIHADWRP